MATHLITDITLCLKTQLGTPNELLFYPRWGGKKTIPCLMFHHSVPLTCPKSSKSFL